MEIEPNKNIFEWIGSKYVFEKKKKEKKRGRDIKKIYSVIISKRKKIIYKKIKTTDISMIS